jgi:hypothetical protein
VPASAIDPENVDRVVGLARWNVEPFLWMQTTAKS